MECAGSTTVSGQGQRQHDLVGAQSFCMAGRRGGLDAWKFTVDISDILYFSLAGALEKGRVSEEESKAGGGWLLSEEGGGHKGPKFPPISRKTGA